MQINRKIKNAPAEASSLERKIVESEELRTKLISVQPIVQLVRNITETELPELNNSLEEAAEILISLRRERETVGIYNCCSIEYNSVYNIIGLAGK